MKILVTITLATLLAMTANASADGVATLNTARGLFNHGDYQGCLDASQAEVSRLYDTRLSPLTDRQRQAGYELRLLRAESELKLKDAVGASVEFQAAARLAGDRSESMRLNMLSGLLQKNLSLVYRPNTAADGRSYDLTNAANRSDALKAVFEEEYAKVKKVIDLEYRNGMLPAMGQASARAVAMSTIEAAVTGSTPRTDAWLMQLATHTRDMVSDDLTRIEQTNRDFSGRLQQAASAGQSLHGALSADERRQLQNNFEFAGNVETATNAGRDRTGSTVSADLWQSMYDRAQHAEADAKALLDQTK